MQSESRIVERVKGRRRVEPTKLPDTFYTSGAKGHRLTHLWTRNLFIENRRLKNAKAFRLGVFFFVAFLNGIMAVIFSKKKPMTFEVEAFNCGKSSLFKVNLNVTIAILMLFQKLPSVGTHHFY